MASIDIMSTELVLVSLLGWLSGMVTGLLPGISATVLLIGFYPWLLDLSILQLFVFYAVMLSTSQYFGSVSAIVYGVPGEITSVPAVRYGHQLFQQGRGDLALSSTATGSFVASVIGISAIFLASLNLDFFVLFFDNTIKTLYLLLAMCVLIGFCNHVRQGLVFAMLGLILGAIGYQGTLRSHVLSNTHWLDNGIDFFPIFVGLLVIPSLLQNIKIKDEASLFLVPPSRLMTRFYNLISCRGWSSMLRGSIIGSLAGIIPGISYAISSALASALERKVAVKDRDLRCLISAESANNAGALIVLIPLIFLALPIVPSEAVIMNIAQHQGFSYVTSHDFIKNNLMILITIVSCISVLNWMVAGYYYGAVVKVYNVCKPYVYLMAIILVIGLLLLIANNNNSIISTIITLIIALIFGWKIQSDDSKIVFIFSFFLSDSIIAELHRFYIFNFT